MYKKRWYDGLHDIYEGKNEFEIKFGCFGGDGGGKGGGSKTPAPPSDPAPDPKSDTGYRGEDSAARSSAADTAAAAAAAGLGSGYGPGTKSKSDVAKDIQDKVADAVAASQQGSANLDTSMQNMSINEALGLSIPSVTEQLAPTQVGLPGTTMAPAAKSLADMYADAQKAVANQAYSSLGPQKSQAQQNLEASLNQGIQGAQFSSPATAGFQGVSPFNPATTGGFGLGVEAKFGLAKGGVVQQGIGSIFPYPRR